MRFKKIIVLVFCFLVFFSSSVFAIENKAQVKFYKGIDGDTAKFDVEGEIVTVRFIGINAPEIAHDGNEAEAYGDEASNFTTSKLQNAKKIELEFDEKAGKTDKYDRTLAWVWIDGELLQDLLIKEGLSTTKYLKDNYKYASQLKISEIDAKTQKIGIWSGEQTQVENENKEKKNSNNESKIKKIYENNKKNIAITCGVIIFMYIISKGRVALKNKRTKEKWRNK